MVVDFGDLITQAEDLANDLKEARQDPAVLPRLSYRAYQLGEEIAQAYDDHRGGER